MSIYPAWLFLRVLDMVLEAFYDDLIFRGDARMNPFSEKKQKSGDIYIVERSE